MLAVTHSELSAGVLRSLKIHELTDISPRFPRRLPLGTRDPVGTVADPEESGFGCLRSTHLMPKWVALELAEPLEFRQDF